MTARSTHNLQRTKVEAKPILYGEAMAMSLIKYAAQDAEFTKKLRWIVVGLDSKEIDSLPEIKDIIDILLPSDTESALRRAEWLVKAIEEENIPGAETAAAMLSRWAYERTSEDARQIVVGVVQVAIPGITLGKLKIKKAMPVIIRDDIAEIHDIETSRRISEATLGIMNRALRISGGNVHKIEPELGDWFFGDMELSFKSASEREMIKIDDELTGLGVIHSVVKKDASPAVIAICPSVNTASWDLKPMK